MKKLFLIPFVFVVFAAGLIIGALLIATDLTGWPL
jgi:hypothetical protein